MEVDKYHKSHQIGKLLYTPIIGTLEKSNGETVNLTWNEDVALNVLIDKPDEVLRDSYILDAMRNKGAKFRKGLRIQTVRLLIRSVREKMGDEGKRIVKLTRVGYMYLSKLPIPSSEGPLFDQELEDEY